MPPKEKTYPLSQIAKTAATKTEQCLQMFTKYSPTASHMKLSKKKKAGVSTNGRAYTYTYT